VERYEIRLEGRLDARWTDWFGGMALTTTDRGTTLRGPVADQAALHGLLRRVHDLGLPLVAVTRLDPHRDPHRDTHRDTGSPS
jgi:hypothetical protein